MGLGYRFRGARGRALLGWPRRVSPFSAERTGENSHSQASFEPMRAMKTFLFVGGLVAAGFDPASQFLLTVSHAGRGVFKVGSWERVARDTALAYPENGRAIGIGPLEGLTLAVTEVDSETGRLQFESPDGAYRVEYDSGTITVADTNA